MILTSQNRIAVIQANSVRNRGQVLAAAVVHQDASTMRPYSRMQRTRLPFGTTPTFPKSKRRSAEGHRHLPVSCDSGLHLDARLWARLVLSKMSRG
jgi:hypothetical protein